MLVMSVVGARPQFVKAAVVGRAVRRRHQEILVHTGQHYDEGMSDLFFRELHLPAPDHHLGVGSGTHAEQTGRMLPAIEAVILEQRPDVVLVYGDTNSTLAGALAAAKLGVPVAHVEAGCRSGDRTMPEEINRVVTDRVSRLLFCATRLAVEHLAREGLTEGVHQVGDVMLDLCRERLPEAEARIPALLAALGLEPGRYFVATVHRAATTDDRARLTGLVGALGELDDDVVFPVHPRTRRALDGFPFPPRLRPVEPVGYLDMLGLVRHARMVLTDSGGVQKEAFFLGTPCLTLRESTEWPETVEAGWNRLVGSDARAIRCAVASWKPRGIAPVGLFGDGRAGERIADLLEARQ
jgi:UDP-GlcNAc3NAcA epimerase